MFNLRLKMLDVEFDVNIDTLNYENVLKPNEKLGELSIKKVQSGIRMCEKRISTLLNSKRIIENNLNNDSNKDEDELRFKLKNIELNISREKTELEKLNMLLEKCNQGDITVVTTNEDLSDNGDLILDFKSLGKYTNLIKGINTPYREKIYLSRFRGNIITTMLVDKVLHKTGLYGTMQKFMKHRNDVGSKHMTSERFGDAQKSAFLYNEFWRAISNEKLKMSDPNSKGLNLELDLDVDSEFYNMLKAVVEEFANCGLALEVSSGSVLQDYLAIIKKLENTVKVAILKKYAELQECAILLLQGKYAIIQHDFMSCYTDDIPVRLINHPSGIDRYLTEIRKGIQ